MKMRLEFDYGMNSFYYHVNPSKEEYIDYLWEAYGPDTNIDIPSRGKALLDEIARIRDSIKLPNTKEATEAFVSGVRYGITSILNKLFDEFPSIEEQLDDDDGFIDYLKDIYEDEARDAYVADNGDNEDIEYV